MTHITCDICGKQRDKAQMVITSKKRRPMTRTDVCANCAVHVTNAIGAVRHKTREGQRARARSDADQRARARLEAKRA